MISICDDLLLSAGDGQVIFRSGRNVTTPPDLIARLSQWSDAPAGVIVLVSTADLQSERLRNHLQRHVDQGVDVMVKVFDPDTRTAVTDTATLTRASEFFGVAISHPVAQGVDGRPERSIPAAIERQRTALTELAALPEPPSAAKLRQWLASPAAQDSPQARLAGVPRALLGAPLDAKDWLLPASPAQVSDGLLGTFQPADPDVLRAEFGPGGRAAAALVRGWNPETGEPQTAWLIAENGQPHWVPADGGALKPLGDGETDPYAAMIERHGSALLLDSTGAPYTRELPATAATQPRLAVGTRAADKAVLIGQWSDQHNTRREMIRQAAKIFDQPVILVDVRRVVDREGRQWLTPALRAELHETLRRFRDVPRVVVATESNHELSDIAKRYGATSVVPMTSLGGLSETPQWKVEAGIQLSPVPPIDSLTSETLHGAKDMAVSPDTTTPAEVRGLLDLHTWQEVEQYLEANRERLQELGADQHVDRLLRESLDADKESAGLIKPFPDRALAAFHVLLRPGMRAEAGPRSVVEPQHVFVTEKTTPHVAAVNERFLLGYLNNRPLDAGRHGGKTPAGAYTTGLLWLRELIQAAVSPESRLSPADALAIIQGRGELDGERAARRPDMPDRLGAHATVAEAAFRILYPDQIASRPDRETLLTAMDCLSGEDRMAWAHIIWDVLEPAGMEPHKTPLNKLLNTIATCP
jgi:hypothetical protein